VSKLKGFKTIKRFVLRYWLEGKHKKITLGIFKPGFGIKEINDKLYQINNLFFNPTKNVKASLPEDIW